MEPDYSRPVVAKLRFGMDVEPRGKCVLNGVVYQMAPIITLSIKEDESWHRKNVQFDAGWLDDLITCATEAKAYINGSLLRRKPDPDYAAMNALGDVE